MKTKFLALWIFASLLIMAGFPVYAGEIRLEDKSWMAAFDAESGALTRLENKSTHWTIEQRSELGVSFRLNAPLADHKDNFILGQKQRAVEVKKLSDHQIRLRWKNLSSEHGGVLQMTMTAVTTLKDGALIFDATIENESPVMVSTIDYPCFGDLNPPAPNARLWSEHMWYGDLKSGAISPSGSVESKQSLFCLIQSTNAGLYVGMHDATQPYLLQFNFEQRRGAGKPEEFRTRHFAYVHPHSKVKLAPVVFRGYEGDWHAGVDCYKEWRATWFKQPHLPDWAKEVHSWSMLRLNTPEQDYSILYTNLMQYGDEYASNGVRAVQVVGWNIGGQDSDDPSQKTDPQLGTWQEFHDTIAQIQAKGVKIILFGKLNWADLTTAWYSNKLYQYECTDQNGKRYEQGGYSYVTPTQLAGLNNHRRAVMDFLDPAYRDIAAEEFDKILALGSEGWLWDELCHHAGTEYSWAANHGYTPPGYVYGGDLPLGMRLRSKADKISPDFLFCGEGQQDWLMQYFPVSETGITAIPICQYIDPHALMLAGVSGFDDREMLNLILMDRYVIQYEPYFYKGHLTDFPLTLAYGKKIDDLRRKYKAYLWDGEFRDMLGAAVSADGSHRYSVFVTSKGKRAVVVINQEFNKLITAKVNVPNARKLIVATPEQPDAQPSTGTLQIPARSAAVIMER